MGGVFVVETLSVMMQVASFKLTGKRVFRMAPLHHHYELKGWKENQVVVRFWIITMLLVPVRPVDAEAALKAMHETSYRAHRNVRRARRSATTGPVAGALARAPRRARCASPTRAPSRRTRAALAARAAAACRSTPAPFTDATLARRRPGRDQPGLSPRATQPRDRAAAGRARRRARRRRHRAFARCALPRGAEAVARALDTGTNGKTTVTALDRRAVRRAAGLRPCVAGNIGAPCSTRSPRARATARRGPRSACSSCRASSSRRTSIAASPTPRRCSTSPQDHLDRYARLADYAAAKARIFAQRRRRRCSTATTRWRCGDGAVPGRTRRRPSAPSMPARPRTSGASCAATARRWLRGAAASLLVPSTTLRLRRPPQRRQRAGRAGARSTRSRARPRRCCDALREFRGLPHRVRARRRSATASRFVRRSRARTSARPWPRSSGIDAPGWC